MRIYIQLGSNLGDRSRMLLQAQNYISAHIGAITKKSAVYETEPWMMDSEKWFLNMVVEVESNLDAHSLMLKMKHFEEHLGRNTGKKTIGYESRIIDMDILFYGSEIINSSDLVVPHPFLHERKFVLIPMNEVNSDFVHPIFNKTIDQLLEKCNDTYQVSLYTKSKISI